MAPVTARVLHPVAMGIFLAACATSPPAMHVTHTTSVLSLVRASCAGCGGESVGSLKRLDGVESASFDRDRVELTVVHDPSVVDVDALVAAISGGDYTVQVGAGHGSYAAAPTFAQGLDVAWINKDGADVDYERHLAVGRVTVVDFFAEWCGPCKDVDRAMAGLMAGRPDVALRKIDIVDWESPVAKARLAGVKSLPYVIVFGPDGKQREAIVGKDLPRLFAVIGEAAPASAGLPAP